MKKQTKKFDKKKFLGVMLAGLFAMALVTGAVLTYYGQINQTITVEQGLTVDGKAWNNPISEAMSTTSIESPVFMSVHYLGNTANVDGEADITQTCNPQSSTYSCDEIDTAYFLTNLRSGSLALSLKDSSWNELTIGSDDVVVEYSTNVETGETKIDSIDWNGETDYTLIYYADEEFDTFGERLATPGQAYALSVNDVIPISENDGNLEDNVDYCDTDNYDYCRGIKLWAVRDADLSGNTISWNSGWQSAYYFETDMLGWNHLTGELDDPVSVASNSELDFVIINDFPIGTVPTTYTIKTQFSPTA